MRTLNRNKKTIYHSAYSAKTAVVDASGYATGEYTETYGTPYALNCLCQAINGQVAMEKYGVASHSVYELTISVADFTAHPIVETDRVWINKVPVSPYKDFNCVVQSISPPDTISGTYSVAVKEVV